MGFFYDIYKGKRKKYCSMCGCLLMPDSESDICECCIDELYNSDPGEYEVEE